MTVKKIFAALILILISLSFVLASFDLENYYVEEIYAQSGKLKGHINISLTDEPVNSFLILDDATNNITLLDLLELNEYQYTYTCTPINCDTAYSAENPETTKSFQLNSGQTAIYGLKLTGNLNGINSIDLTIDSDATSSCTNQLKVDFLDDGTYEIENKNLSHQLCSDAKFKGCYVSSNEDFILDDKHYCQRINLPNAPGFKFGALVKEHTAGNKRIFMELFNSNGRSLSDADCELDTSQASASGAEISCDVNYLVEEAEDYYVCIYAGSGTGDYRIQGHDDPSTACGFHNQPFSNPDETAAYNIFAQVKKFDDFEEITIQSISSVDGLAKDIDDYLDDKYNDRCNEGCVVPIKFSSAKSQTITLSGLSVVLDTGAIDEEFYDLSDSIAVVNSETGKLKLDNSNLTVPSEVGEHDISLKLNTDEIFSHDITVEELAAINGLYPLSVAAGNPTEFTVFVTEGKANITKFKWDFGNGDTEQSTVNKITYTYNATGNYDLEIIAVDKDLSESSKTFDINVGSPQDVANSTLEEKLQHLTNVKTTLGDYDLFTKAQIEKILDLTSTEDELKRLQRKFSGAVDEEDYIDVMQGLVGIDVPISVDKIQDSGFLTYFPKENLIDLEVFDEISGDTYESSQESKYIDALLGWNAQNMDTKIKFQEFAVEFNSGVTPVLSLFDLQVSQKSSLNYDVYVVFLEMEGLAFKEDYSIRDRTDYQYIRLTDTQKTFTFSTTEEIDFTALPVFISPGLKQLSTQTIGQGEDPKFPWALFFLVIGLIIMLAIVGYFVMQVWYKTKYEKHLFKNRKDLYNILAYIHNVKRKGLKGNAIKVKLQKAGWTNEQITYAMKKYSGKPTGLPSPKLPEVKLGKKKPGKPVSNIKKRPSTRLPR